MALIVQKFGGASVATVEKIGEVADRVARRRAQGDDLVVVVSAMQGETDRLLGLAQAVDARPDPRETDALVATGEQVAAALLAIALRRRNVPARSLTGPQMSLRTDGVFSRARIKSIERGAIDKALGMGEVVVATGFQGIDDHGNLTTLGRGGSDTSAVALAAALGAHECEFYKDVLGVYTADPKVVPSARKLDVITFEEMMELASLGAKVLQIRSVELAMNHDMPLRVRSFTSEEDLGTLVTGAEDDEALERLVVRGVSSNKNEAKLTLRHVPDRPGVAARIFTALAAAHINVDVIVQNTSEAGTTDLSFTVGKTDRVTAEEIIRRVAKDVEAKGVEVDEGIAKVSIVGVGMRAHPGVAAAMFEALAKASVNIQMITTSEIKVTCVIGKDDADKAVRALHAEFALDKAPPATLIPKVASSRSAPAARKKPARTTAKKPARKASKAAKSRR